MAFQRVGMFCGLVAAAGVWLAAPVSAQQPAPSPVPPQPSTGPAIPSPAIPPPPIAPTTTAMPTSPTSGFTVQSSGVPMPAGFSPQMRFTFNIAPNTPLKDLLPAPPETTRPGPMLTDDLARVPEVAFSARTGKSTPDARKSEQVAHQLAKISHVNAKKTDAFMTALLASRDDLAGMPFAMGDDCRTAGERTKQFTQAVAIVRQAMQMLAPSGAQITTAVMTASGQRQFSSTGGAASFWNYYAALCEQEEASQRTDSEKASAIARARIAALMQMLAAESPEVRLGLVKHLTAAPHVEATKALARMAVFSAEDDIRLAAIEALKVRREKDYTNILLAGLRYPLPAVARRSADAIARLGRTDLIPDLVAVLSTDDPRLPAVKTEDGKPVAVVREMVKVNHHRNCMMCHSPGNPGTVSADAITAEVPVEGQPLPQPSQGYGQSSPDMMVRIDVTYLRQDFSAMLTVADAHPWPELQRFDFLVRERKLTAQEADDFKEKLTPREPGVLSPYHRSALAALRELTGKDAAPTAEAWQKLLGLPAGKPRGQG